MKIKQIIIKENTNDNINIKKDEAKPKEIIPLFGLKEKPKEENNAKKEKKKRKDANHNISLFGNSGGGLFNNQLKINQLLHYLAILIPILAMKKKSLKRFLIIRKLLYFLT